jgi:hypothetical protein
MNTLSKEDSLLFHKLMDSLLLFVNQKTGIIKNATNMKELHQKEIETLGKNESPTKSASDVDLAAHVKGVHEP